MAKNLRVPPEHPVAKAKENSQALEGQQQELWSQYSKIAQIATKEAGDKLINEGNTILQQVRQEEQAPDGRLAVCLDEQKATILPQQVELATQKQVLTVTLQPMCNRLGSVIRKPSSRKRSRSSLWQKRNDLHININGKTLTRSS